MKPCWHRSSPFPNESGRQESNLSSTAYQTVALPLGIGPHERPVRESNPSHLLDRQAGTPASSQGVRVSGGSRTRLSDAAGRCLGCSATDTPAWAEGVEPSACGLEPHYSPRSTPLSIQLPRQDSNLQPSR